MKRIYVLCFSKWVLLFFISVHTHHQNAYATVSNSCLDAVLRMEIMMMMMVVAMMMVLLLAQASNDDCDENTFHMFLMYVKMP